MMLRAAQLASHLARGPLAPLYVVTGDEPLQAQEAADAIRTAARAAGCSERQVHHVAGAHVDWSGILGSAQSMSLFAERRLVEIRMPSGKPGKDGAQALADWAGRLGDDVVTLVLLPRLDATQAKSAWYGALERAGVVVRVDAVERRELPRWLAQRLAAQGQRVADGEEGERTLAFFADRVEGNLLAAHQELQRLALLHPGATLRFDDVEQVVLDVARFDVFKLGEALLAGRLARALRMLDGLRAEGEAAVLVHWAIAEEARALARVRRAVDTGTPLPLALRGERVWGPREQAFERLVPRLSLAALTPVVQAASICDGIVKGLRHPEWPADPWAALRRLARQLVEALAASPRRPAGARP